jgi:spore coat polysaccharide biosynthesis protein SpsF
MNATTEQELFWHGQFGTEYTERNAGARAIASSTALFAHILARTRGVGSVLELGSNRGNNLVALRRLLPDARMSAVEINPSAAAHLAETLPDVELHKTSILRFEPQRRFDLVFTKGVLIHIAPEQLEQVYALLLRCTARYVLLAEYVNPTPVEVSYRGQANKLFKRDFAGELLDRYPELALVDYGFAWRRDPNFPQDDLCWFLLERRPADAA